MARPVWTFDRRRRTRLKGCGVVQLAVGGIEGPAVVHDIGTGGAVVSITRPLTPRTPCAIVLRCDEARWTIRGHIVHCRADLTLAGQQAVYVAGIAFDTVPGDAVSAFDALRRGAGGR